MACAPGSGRQRRAVDRDAGQPVQPDDLDEPQDLRLRAADQDLPTRVAYAPRDHRDVHHQRWVGEDEVVQVDEERPTRVQRL